MSGGDEVERRVKLLVVLSALLAVAAQAASGGEDVQRRLYAVNQSAKDRGSISVDDIDAGHRLVKTIPTVAGVANVKGVAASATTGRFYVAYRDRAAFGMLYCLNLYDATILCAKVAAPGVDRLAISADVDL